MAPSAGPEALPILVPGSQLKSHVKASVLYGPGDLRLV